jgi:hypothetical protein
MVLKPKENINDGYQPHIGKKVNNGHQPGPVYKQGNPPSGGSKVKKNGK